MRMTHTPGYLNLNNFHANKNSNTLSKYYIVLLDALHSHLNPIIGPNHTSKGY